MGTLTTGAFLAKQTGILGAGSVAAPAVPAPVLATGTAAAPAVTALPATTALPAALSTGTTAATGAATTTGLAAAPEVAGTAGTTGATGSLAGIGAAAPVAAGALGGFVASKLPIPRYGRALTGAALGAGAGFLIAGPLGAVIGGVAGGLGGGFCIMVTACADNLEEIELARHFRDKYMSHAQLRAYYAIAEPIVVRMNADEVYCQEIRTALVKPLLRYGAYLLNESTTPPSQHDSAVANSFLSWLEALGSHMQPFSRQNGEVW